MNHNRNPKQPYPSLFREQMIELVRTGRKPGDLAKEFGCHVSSIMNWMRRADEASGIAPLQAGAPSASERQELIELRCKLRQVQMERDILAMLDPSTPPGASLLSIGCQGMSCAFT